MPVPTGELPRWTNIDLNLFGGDIAEHVINSQAAVTDIYDTKYEQRTLRIWRVTKYRAIHWPDELYSHFWEEDVYILLHTHVDPYGGGKPQYNIHFWIGKGASPADYAAGAFKVQELDEKLSFSAVVHRHVQGKESHVFLNCFEHVTVWLGSSSQSFQAIHGGPYKARLLRWYRPDRRRDNVRVKEVPAEMNNLHSENVMILDLGNQLYQWNGGEASETDVSTAFAYVQLLKADRGGETKITVVEEETQDSDSYFNFYLTEGQFRDPGDIVDSDDETAHRVSQSMGTIKTKHPHVFSVEVKRGRIDFKSVRSNKIHMKDIQSHAITLFDNIDQLFIYFSSSAGIDERQMGLEFAHEYLRRSQYPLVPVMFIREGNVPGELERALATTTRK